MGRRQAAIAIAIALVIGTGIGQHFARADSPDPTVIGCFDTKSGALRVLVDDSDKCDSATETPLSWNESQGSTRWYRDADGDGYGDWYDFVDSPAQPPGFVADNTDCDDNKSTTNPGETTDPGPGDRNCNGIEAEDRVITWYRDADSDGWGDRSETTRAPMLDRPRGYVYRYGDCNDHNAKVVPYRGDCYTTPRNSPGSGGPYDIDGDGHSAVNAPGSHGGDDCNDADVHEFPGNPEVTDVDGHDEDCNEVTGLVMLDDPRFLDPRLHKVPVDFQLHFDADGRVRNQTGSIGIGPTAAVMEYPDSVVCPDRVDPCGIWVTPPLSR